MTVAKFWDGTTWVRVSSTPGPVGPQGPPGAGGLIAVQRLVGAQGAYSADLSGSAVNNVYVDASNLLRLQFTPAVHCWWEVHLHMGLVQKKDAAYNYAYGGIQLSPADADGVSGFNDVDTQHSTVQTFTSRDVTAMCKLNANTAYTAQAIFGSGSGGTFAYYRDAGRLYMHSKAWVR